jgi:TPR repeat protein
MIDRTLLAEARAGDAFAQRCLGDIYERGRKNRLNTQKAAFWYHKAAEQGDYEALFLLGLHYDYLTPEPDYEQAAVWHRKAAELGDARAQFRLADMYEEGFGLPVDFAQAAFWYLQAAEQDEPFAQHSLAHAYANGRGVRKNRTNAAYWYRKAAEHPDYDWSADAKRELCILYTSGLKDFTKAAVWLRKSAADGDLESMVDLADLYADGLGVRRNYKQAATWYRKAASFGDTRALVKLGESYAEGKGVRKSFADAYYCLTFAASKMGGKERVIAEKKAAIAGANLKPLELFTAMRRIKRHLRTVNQSAERRILKIEAMRAKMGKNYKKKPTVRKVVFLFR